MSGPLRCIVPRSVGETIIRKGPCFTGDAGRIVVARFLTVPPGLTTGLHGVTGDLRSADVARSGNRATTGVRAIRRFENGPNEPQGRQHNLPAMPHPVR